MRQLPTKFEGIFFDRGNITKIKECEPPTGIKSICFDSDIF